MQREFEIFSKSAAPTVTVKRGFSWPGFFFTWIWALRRGLWWEAGWLFLAELAVILLKFLVLAGNPVFAILIGLAIRMVVGLNGNLWRNRKLERHGYGFAGILVARSPAAASAAYSLGRAPALTTRHVAGSFFSFPSWFQHLLAITWLTWKAALRFRLFLVLALLLLVSVIGLPFLVKDDGTARGFTQILLTYTLSLITALLGLCTLWLACGTLARDIEECQIQVVAVKPVARWQIWLGKWLGIVTLNAALLALSGAAVYGLLLWRATKLPPDQQAVLRNEILVARGSAREKSLDTRIEGETERVFQERLKQNPSAAELSDTEKKEARKQIREQIKAEVQVVPSGTYRPWQIDFGAAADSLRDQPLQLRVKFNAAAKTASGTFYAMWYVGVPPRVWRTEEPMSLAPDTFHEFEIPANLIDDKGVLTIVFGNANNTALLFPLEDGMEVLYREGGFGLNFARGLGLIFCWMALLAALGLCTASFLSFPVAAFCSFGLLVLGTSAGGVLKQVAEGTALEKNPVYQGVTQALARYQSFSPIEPLSLGRSIEWSHLALAALMVTVLLGGLAAAAGIYIFNRRELATAQGNR